MAKTGMDAYANYVKGKLVSTAGVVAAQKIDLGYGVLDRTAMVVHRLELQVDYSRFDEMAATARLALASQEVTAPYLTIDSDKILALVELSEYVPATQAFTVLQQPVAVDYNHLKGGGLLVPAKPLTIMWSAGAVGESITGYWRLFFSLIQTDDSTYIEMLQNVGVFGGV